jgi:hypothetical protein
MSKTENWQKFKTIILKVNAKTIMKNEYVTNVHGFNPKPAGSVDKATQLGNRMTLHKIMKKTNETRKQATFNRLIYGLYHLTCTAVIKYSFFIFSVFLK